MPDPTLALAALRTAAGGLTWLSPRTSWRTFGLGRPEQVLPSGGLALRLFGVRDVVLAAAVRHPEPAVRRAALQAGLVCDTADVAATLLAVRAGAPRTTLLGVGAGAALFVGLGTAGLRRA